MAAAGHLPTVFSDHGNHGSFKFPFRSSPNVHKAPRVSVRNMGRVMGHKGLAHESKEILQTKFYDDKNKTKSRPKPMIRVLGLSWCASTGIAPIARDDCSSSVPPSSTMAGRGGSNLQQSFGGGAGRGAPPPSNQGTFNQQQGFGGGGAGDGATVPRLCQGGGQA